MEGTCRQANYEGHSSSAFTGTCGQDAELKTSKSGKPWTSFSVAIDEASEEATTWARVAVLANWLLGVTPEVSCHILLIHRP